MTTKARKEALKRQQGIKNPEAPEVRTPVAPIPVRGHAETPDIAELKAASKRPSATEIAEAKKILEQSKQLPDKMLMTVNTRAAEVLIYAGFRILAVTGDSIMEGEKRYYFDMLESEDMLRAFSEAKRKDLKRKNFQKYEDLTTENFPKEFTVVDKIKPSVPKDSALKDSLNKGYAKRATNVQDIDSAVLKN